MMKFLNKKFLKKQNWEYLKKEFTLFQKTKTSNQEEKLEIKSLEESLKESALNFQFNEDYSDLLEIGEDEGSFGNFVLENENFFLFDEDFERTQYLKEELYPTKGPEVKISDIFVTKPKNWF